MSTSVVRASRQHKPLTVVVFNSWQASPPETNISEIIYGSWEIIEFFKLSFSEHPRRNHPEAPKDQHAPVR